MNPGEVDGQRDGKVELKKNVIKKKSIQQNFTAFFAKMFVLRICKKLLYIKSIGTSLTLHIIMLDLHNMDENSSVNCYRNRKL